MAEDDVWALQDDCLIAITDGQPLRSATIRRLPPWRAVLLARVAAQAGISLEEGTVEQLVDEARRVGGGGTLTWPRRSTSGRGGGPTDEQMPRLPA